MGGDDGEADPAGAPADAARAAAGYRERLSVPTWWHLPGVLIAAVFGAESSFLAGGLVAQLVVIAVFIALGELLLWRYGAKVVEVTDGRVRAGQWRLPVARVRGVAVLDPRQTRAEMTRRDDSVYRCTRSWIPGALLLDVDDPADLPLWLVSSRHPEQLAAALADAAVTAR